MFECERIAISKLSEVELKSIEGAQMVFSNDATETPNRMPNVRTELSWKAPATFEEKTTLGE